MSKKWFRTGYLKGMPAQVDQEAGVIRTVKVCSEGEAAGHGFHVDEEFIATLVSQGNGSKKGLKARFGHPTMCSEALGTFIGRFKNFSKGTTVRDDGTKAACCFADLHLSESAKDTPNGDLHGYVMAMAENEADMFGTSIVFKTGPRYRRNSKGEKIYPRNQAGEWNDEFDQAGGPDYVECEQLMACDCVDDPAANDGLFSGFAGETVAGQISDFLDLHPQLFQLLEDNPEVMEVIAQHGDKFEEFFSRYREYRARLTQNNNESDNSTIKEANMSDETKETKAPDTVENPETKTDDTPEKETAPEAAASQPVDVQAAVNEALAKDRKRAAEIEELGEKFGFTEAAKEFKEGGKSVEEFRKYILNKSPEDWRESLAIKNPAEQVSEEALETNAEGQEAVDRIKASRRAVSGNQ